MRKVLTRLMTAAVLSVFLTTAAEAANLFGPKELDTTFGGEVRLRQEIYENTFDLSARGAQDRDYFRLRTLVFGKLDYNKKVDFYVRLGNEMKFYNELWASYRSNNHFYVPDELYVDNMYVSFYKICGFPVDLRVGRQDIMLGDGFLVAEGTPGDGSRSMFFDAVRGTVNFSKNYSLDLIGVSDSNKDKYGVLKHDDLYDKTLINAGDEQGLIIYGHGQITDSLLIEPYYIYKREEAFTSTSITVSTLDLNTFGARAAFTQGAVTLKGELAYQTGGYDDGRSRRGLGGHAEVVAKFNDVKLKPQVEVGFIGLSGDDPSTTGKVEAWDPLFSRYPIWSDVYVYTLAAETTGLGGAGFAYWTNLQIYRAIAKLNFDAATYCQIGYAWLRANEQANRNSAYMLSANRVMFSTDGKDRGQLLQAKVYHAFTKALDAYISADYLLPGDYYASANNTLFVRWQVNYKF